MAPVLQCPECGTKHPIDTVPERGAFPCTGCGRVLKVPEIVAEKARAAAPAAAAATTAAPVVAPPAPSAAAPVAPPAPARTQALPVVERSPRSAEKAAPATPSPSAGGLGKVPLWMRLLLWVAAIPAGFIIVFSVARAFGFFTSNQLSDLFLADGNDRFMPLVRVLPFVALVAALIVHGGVYLIARRRGRRASAAPSTLSPSTNGDLAQTRQR